jgi:hypothetical protein
VPDGGGQGEDALQDAGQHAGGVVPAVAFEVELALEGVVDGLDDLAQRLEVPGAPHGHAATILEYRPRRQPTLDGSRRLA